MGLLTAGHVAAAASEEEQPVTAKLALNDAARHVNRTVLDFMIYLVEFVSLKSRHEACFKI